MCLSDARFAPPKTSAGIAPRHSPQRTVTIGPAPKVLWGQRWLVGAAVDVRDATKALEIAAAPIANAGVLGARHDERDRVLEGRRKRSPVVAAARRALDDDANLEAARDVLARLTFQP